MGVTDPKWSVVIGYYNERDFITDTIRSALAQTGTSLRLILVDNRSDDGTEEVCRDLLRDNSAFETLYVHEARPGHAYAIDAGYQHVTTPYVAFWDADTSYPADYLAEAERLLSSGRYVAAQAIDVYCPPLSFSGWLRRFRMRLTHKLLPRQGHTGTFGQCFRTESLRAAGGPMSADWPYVLEDHELMQRVLKVGPATGSMKLWCLPLPRRSSSAHVRWNLFERILYHITPFALKDWFFYSFLGPRFEQRRMKQENLRVRDW